jgi:hypothetical protein
MIWLSVLGVLALDESDNIYPSIPNWCLYGLIFVSQIPGEKVRAESRHCALSAL